MGFLDSLFGKKENMQTGAPVQTNPSDPQQAQQPQQQQQPQQVQQPQVGQPSVQQSEQPQQPQQPQQTKQSDVVDLTAQQKKVLIVEDEALLANALELKFKNEGYAVFKAANGQLGLDSAFANRPDIILLDIQMPVMDGKTMMKKLKEIPELKNIPVIVLTNSGDLDNIREMKSYYGVNSFLIKSNVSPDEIVMNAKEYLSGNYIGQYQES